MTTRPLRIVLSGGSGLIGQLLARHFHQRGDQVTVLTRGPYTVPWQTVHWDGVNIGSWTDTLEGADVCIHLAGRSVNCRYNAENRRAIYESRIGSTQLVGRAIANLTTPPRLWMNASAATIYERALDENGVDRPREEADSTPDDSCDRPDALLARSPARWAERRGFTRRVVLDWEAAFFAAATPRTRKIALRTSIVLSPTPASAFAILTRLVRLGLGGRQGSGRQFMSWMHAADYARAIAFLVEREDLSGAFNLAAPAPLPNRDFMAALREAWEMPNGLPAPRLAIELGALLMRTESELVLTSSRAVPTRLLQAGFKFEFPEWPGAAKDLAGQWRRRNS